ncbi:MAG: Eco57I restriction-modification methylase domain-containing protein [Bacteroidia bacterium]
MESFNYAYTKIKELASDFKAGERHYLSKGYQEAEVRKDFIDKFWMALGWDVHHNIQKNPFEQEVKVEKGVVVSGAQKRADYSFSLSPNYRDPKFFVEAKKPAQNLFDEDYYFQTIRYGWHKNTPISVLTDFEEFHILDCRYSPDINTILTKQVKRFHYTDYCDEEKFSYIYWIFSREAVENNSIEKISETLPKPKGKSVQKALFPYENLQSIDDTFLKEIEEKREILAKALKKNDETLNSEELTEATQKILDRLVFMRFLEDKLIEQEHYVNTFGERGSAWTDFINASRKFEAKYNGIVFRRSFIDDPGFKGPVGTEFYRICQDMCHLNSRFLFNEIPVHIMGSIYERFLGKVVHATDHRVKIEEKHEVRKSGGVYYTPKYIVDYIIQNTIGKLISGKTPEQISKMRFADIACGSGSFLIGVFDFILNYHNKFYQEHPEKAKKDGCYLTKDGVWVMSLRQKQAILKNNIYGVDIDSQAVEVTQLSLSLKMLEDETTATANEMQVLFHEKILPDMTKNIVCGNSLISTDILSQNLFPDNEEKKLNPLDFEATFPEIMKNGGFDAIVGNPPYFRIDEDRPEFAYVRNKFTTAEFKLDIYTLFIENAINQIGFKRLGFIIPNTLMTNLTDRKLRKLILEKTHIDEIVNYHIKVFDQAIVHTMILLLDKNIKNNNIHIQEISKDKTNRYVIPQNELLKNENCSFDIRMFGKDSHILHRIKSKGIPLNKLCNLKQAIKTGDDKKYISHSKIKNNFKEVIGGSEMNRYVLNWQGRYVDYGDHLACPRNPDIFEVSEKLIIRETGKRITATYDDKKYYLMSSVYSAFFYDHIKDYDLKYILGALNSNVSQYYMQKLCFDNSVGVFTKARIFHYNQLPIPGINFKSKSEKALHDKIVQHVEQMLLSKKQTQEAKTEKDKNYYENKCKALDKQIDDLVYKLYDFSEDDIKKIENDLL